MTQETDMNISEQRARAIIDSYGAAADAWPVEERQAMLALLESSASLQAYCAEAARLDKALGIPPAVQDTDRSVLAGKILQNLPPQQEDPPQVSSVWPGLAAAASLAAIIFTVVSLRPVSTPPVAPVNVATVNPATAAFEQWAWEEVLDQTPETSLNGSNDPLSLLLPEFDNNFSDTI